MRKFNSTMKMNLQEFNVPWRSRLFDDDKEKRKSIAAKTEPTKMEPVKTESGKTETVHSEVQLETPETHQEEGYDSFVIASAPKHVRRQAGSSKSSKMGWNQAGRVTYNGNPLQDTNLAELSFDFPCE